MSAYHLRRVLLAIANRAEAQPGMLPPYVSLKRPGTTGDCICGFRQGVCSKVGTLCPAALPILE